MKPRIRRYHLMLEFAAERMLINRKFLADISPKDEQLLNFVALSYYKNEVLQVKDVIDNAELGSAASIHSRISSLKTQKYIKYVPLEDKRCMQVIPGEKYIRYLDALGIAIKKIAS